MQVQVKSEGSTEEATFANFSAFCKETDASKSDAIANGKSAIEASTATIAAKKADLSQTEADVKKRKEAAERLAQEKDDNDANCAKAKATFETTHEDLSAAVTGLQGAVAKLEASSNPSLLQGDASLKKSLALADAMGYVEEKNQETVTAFLQATPYVADAGAEYNKAEYSFQSGGVLATLKDLLVKFKGEQDASQAQWTNTKQSCEDVTKAKTEALTLNAEQLQASSAAAAALQVGIAGEEQTLQQVQKTLREDQKYLADLKETCSARSADFKQRSELRVSELEALNSAIVVLKEKVQAGGSTSAAPSFLQQRQRVNLLRRVARNSVVSRSNLLSRSGAKLSSRAQEAALIAGVLRKLKESGRTLHSVYISHLASKLALDLAENSAASPLETVKAMVQKLVNQLHEEAAKETSEKGNCEVMMNKANSERDRRSSEIQKLDAKMKTLEAKRVQLTDENDILTDQLSKLRESLAQAVTLRTAESAENIAAIKNGKDAALAVKDAAATLASFYKKAQRKAENYDKKSTALLQIAQAPAVGFEGSYKGAQDASEGILGMLDVIKSDFEKTVSETQAEEDKAAADFSKFKSDSNEDIASKEITLKLNNDDVQETEANIQQAAENLKTTKDLLDSALQSLEDLKPTCVDNKMSFEERQAKRQKEIADLKTAVCALDPNGVEADCKTA